MRFPQILREKWGGNASESVFRGDKIGVTLMICQEPDEKMAEAINAPKGGGGRGVMRWLLSWTEEMWMRVTLVALLFGSYFGSLWAAALHFPQSYDWRRNVISNLLSPRDNPHWYWLPSAGVAVAGLCMLPLAAWIENELGDGGSKLARRVRRPAFLVGIGCLILAAVVAPQHLHPVLGMRRAHEALARTSAAGLVVGMLCACASPGLRRRGLRALRLMWWATTLPPIAGAAASGLVVGLARLHVLGAGPADFLRGTVFWHLAFWEWLGSVAGFLFFASPVAVVRGKDEG
jgi:hypothetical protein